MMLSRTACFLLLALSLAIVSALYLQGGLPSHRFFNSDALYLPTLFADVAGGNGHLADWYLTPAPYFFPDFLVFGISWLLADQVWAQVLAFFLIQSALTAGTLWFLAVAMRLPQPLPVATLATVALLFLAAGSHEPFVLQLASGYHYGGFLMSIVVVAIWLRHVQTQSRAAALGLPGAAAVLAYATALSDNLFVLQALIPLVAIAALLIPRTQAAGRLLAVPLAALAAGIAGSLSYPLVVAHPTRYPLDIGIEALPRNLAGMVDLVGATVMSTPLVTIALGAWVALCIGSLKQVLVSRSPAGAPRPLAWLALFSLLSFGATVGAKALIANLPITPRYLIPAFAWPVILTVFWCAGMPARLFRLTWWFGSAALIALLALRTAALPATAPIVSTPADIACIDQATATAGLRHGIAGYWDAKYIQARSREPLQIAQYLDTLDEHRWITSARFFQPRYDFAVLSDSPAPYRIPPEKLIDRAGQPATIAVCGRFTVYLYGTGALSLQPL